MIGYKIRVVLPLDLWILAQCLLLPYTEVQSLLIVWLLIKNIHSMN
jgi:hypothetical protein